MREYELVIDKALKVGLTPYDTVPFNTQVLKECYKFRCGKLGLEKYNPLTNPLPLIEMFYNWPFPQVVTGERYNFLIMRDALFNHEDLVYLISPDHSTLTLIFTIDELTFGVGTLMEVADFGLYAFMTNGVIMIYWDTTLNDWHEVIASPNIPMMRTVCNFKGQAVGGNVVSAWYDCDETYYVWSNIGEMNFNLGRRNEAGYKRDPYGGVIYHTRRLGDSVIGYSSKGITRMSPVQSPAATFGFEELSDIGLINQGAMNGSKDRQVYVGEDCKLRHITARGIEELDYERYMRRLDGTIIVSYEPSKKDFYISDGATTFLLSGDGMSEVSQHPSTVWRSNNSSYMLPDTEDNASPYLCSEIFDMGYKGQKTISSIETDAHAVEDPEAGVDQTHDLSNWSIDHYRPINNMGAASNVVSGNAFRFRLRFSDLLDSFRIGYIKARYKMTDLRSLRGVYAPAPRGQAGGTLRNAD